MPFSFSVRIRNGVMKMGQKIFFVVKRRYSIMISLLLSKICFDKYRVKPEMELLFHLEIRLLLLKHLTEINRDFGAIVTRIIPSFLAIKNFLKI